MSSVRLTLHRNCTAVVRPPLAWSRRHGASALASHSAAGLEIRVWDWQHVIRIELFGDLSRASANRLSDCLERCLETRAERLILDLTGLDRLEPGAMSPILIAHLIADSQHRRLLLVPGSDSVQRVLDRVQGPFVYVEPYGGDSLLGDDLGRSGAFSAGRQRARPGRRMVDLLVGRTDRLIEATEHAPEPIRTLEYAEASALLGALELWLTRWGQSKLRVRLLSAAHAARTPRHSA
jgi:anti-anti-sigma regulatory factor